MPLQLFTYCEARYTPAISASTQKVINHMQQRHTEVVRINPLHPESSFIEHAITLLRANELVVFPTETVYGLGANALQPAAVECIFAAKGRPFSNPLIVHIADQSTLETLVTHISPQT